MFSHNLKTLFVHSVNNLKNNVKNHSDETWIMAGIFLFSAIPVTYGWFIILKELLPKLKYTYFEPHAKPMFLGKKETTETKLRFPGL